MDRVTCLVTGATGFLGGHLAAVLLEAGANVRAYVRPGSETRALAARGVSVVRGEASDRVAIRDAAAGCDFVFHAAGYLTANAPFAAEQDAPAKEAATEWALYQAVNVDFTAALLAASSAAGVARFLFISSSSVYAPDVAVPTPETAPQRPISAYGRSKLLAEEAVRAAQAKGLSTTIVRPPVAYGPGDRMFTPLALRLARLPLLPLVNGGRSLMDLVFARDVAELLWCAARHPMADGRVYNAGPGRPTSLAGLVEAYRRLTGSGPRIVSVSPAMAGRTARLARLLVAPLLPEVNAAFSNQGLSLMAQDLHLAMDLAAAELDFRPRFDLENGLHATLAALEKAKQVRLGR
ncbi:MAG: NAD-dependent epimerase/dehydratase family protein [Candidatus Promineifilaceae bacterium]